MQTLVLATSEQAPDPGVLDCAAEILKRGGLVAFAAETVYGLGASAWNASAVASIFRAKGRPAGNPLIVHAGSVEQAKMCVSAWPGEADRLAAAFWPGPLTLVLPRSSRVPDVTTGGRETVALRIPSTPIALELVARSGAPIAAPSANRSNHVSPTRAEHVLADLNGVIDLVIDSGPTRIGLESTVLDLTTHPARILRPGPISLAELERVLGAGMVGAHVHDAPGDRFASPGRQPVHYAPRTAAYRVDGLEELARAGDLDDSALVILGVPAAGFDSLVLRAIVLETPEAAALELYHVLRTCDAAAPGRIVIVMPPADPAWAAVRDRVVRATSPLA